MPSIETMQLAGSIAIIASEGKFTYQSASSLYTNISSYQLKGFLDKQWDEQLHLQELVDQMTIDWGTGWLIIDDTLIEKPYAKAIEGVYKAYSSKEKRFLPGMTLTLLAWTDGQQTIPLQMMLYEKDKEEKAIESKNEFALRAIQYAHSKGIRPLKVCFDSKYAANVLLNTIHQYGWEYYCQLASNRIFDGKQLKSRRFQPYAEEGRLKGVGHRVRISKYRKRYYVTNATGKLLSTQQIVTEYRVRWKIEELFRALKQVCHIEDCRSRRLSAQRRYITLSIQAFLLLQKENQGTVYVAKKVFQQKQLRLKINADKALRRLAA